MDEATNETNTQNSVTASHSQPPRILWLVLIFLGFLVSGFTGYYFGRQQYKSGITSPEQVDSLTLASPMNKLMDLTLEYIDPTPNHSPAPLFIAGFTFKGLPIDTAIQNALEQESLKTLRQYNIEIDSERANGRQAEITVEKLTSDWLLAMAIVTGETNCVISSGATACGLPANDFRLLATKRNDQWYVANEYTSLLFAKLAAMAPEEIISNNLKK